MIWTENLATGVSIVDDQHKEIILRTERLLSTCTLHEDKIEIENTLDFLSDYVIVHFMCEEDLQVKSEYPDYALHKLEHDAFIKDFIAMRTRYTREGLNDKTITAIHTFVSDWLITHIGISDYVFAMYYTKHSKSF